MELGLYTFADLPLYTGAAGTHERITNLIEEIKLADEAGLDVFGVGEHHRPDYAVSSPATILAAAAMVTKRIRLASAVTVLSSDDPVRVFQQFATVDQLSAGRAEIMAGRGSYIESYPLFGYDLQDYDELFAEKLSLLLELNNKEVLSWEGKHRPSFTDRGVYPRPFAGSIPVWLAVGGTPESAERAGRLGLPMALAIIGGMPERFIPFVQLYRNTYNGAGHAPDKLQLGINSIGYVGEDSKKAADEFYPVYAAMMNRIGRERGWPPIDRQHFDALRQPKGSLMVGSVNEVADKILYEYSLFKHTRFLLQTSVGTLPHAQAMKSIELFGRVAEEVRGVLST